MALERVDEWLGHAIDPAPWELFHENSKLSRRDRHPTFALWPSDATIVRVMRRLRQVKPYADRPVVPLPAAGPPAALPVGTAIRRRVTARSFARGPLELPVLGEILELSYGLSRDNIGTEFPRPFRMVPSGGALYPLEVYVYAAQVEGLAQGLYHYDPLDRELDALRTGDLADEVLGCVVQRDLAAAAAVTLFVTAVFERTTFKYGDRGYRFALLEAGHLAQNACLASTALDVACAPIGGYADRDADRLLGLDGVTESTVYMLLLGTPEEADAATPW